MMSSGRMTYTAEVHCAPYKRAAVFSTITRVFGRFLELLYRKKQK